MPFCRWGADEMKVEKGWLFAKDFLFPIPAFPFLIKQPAFCRSDFVASRLKNGHSKSPRPTALQTLWGLRNQGSRPLFETGWALGRKG